MANINYEVVASGGAIVFTFSNVASGTFTFSRSSDNGATWQTLFSEETYQNELGEVVSPRYVDVGDGTAYPLDQNTAYLYRATDSSGTTTTPAITPVSRLQVGEDHVTQMMIRLIQAGIQGLKLPAGFQTPSVRHAMPLTFGGEPRLPIITVNLDLGPVSQEFPIGVGLNYSATNTDTRTAQVIRKYSITALCKTVPEREFYRDAIIAICTVAAPKVFGAVWDDTSFKYQAYSSQKVGEDNVPGFYFTQVMIELQGSFNATSVGDYGLIEQIDVSNGADQIIDVT